MRRGVFIVTLLSTFSIVYGQDPNVWKTLSKVEIKTKFNESLGFHVEYPIFGDEIKALDGKEITLSGFMMPLAELRGENYFVLSLLPFNNCFFCGGPVRDCHGGLQ